MTLYVLDTDIMGFAIQRHPTVLQRLQHLPEDDLVVTTSITFGEDLGGWLLACRRALDGVARDEPGSFGAYALEELEQSWCTHFACKQATRDIIWRIVAPV